MENNNTNVNTGADNQTTETVVFTDEQKAEIAKMMQAESDRRVTQALAKQKKDYEKKLSLANLDEAEREKAEKDNTIEELRAQIAEFTIEKNRSELKSVLSSRGLSAEFADLINITDDIEESQSKIESLDKLFKIAVKAEVEKRLASSGGAPKGNGTSTSGEITKEMFSKMSLAQQTEIFKNNPEQYNQLIK